MFGYKRKENKTIPEAARKKTLDIIPFETSKNKIEQRPAMEKDIIPKHASSVIFNGKSGSGKTQLLVNLLTRPGFYGKCVKHSCKHKDCEYFDEMYMFSPTADGGDDLAKYLKIPKKHIFPDLNITDLDMLLQKQKEKCDRNGVDKSPKMLVIFEDIQSDAKFMKSKSFLRCFIQGRHINISTFLLGQSWTLTPRACRLQANNIFFFRGSGSEHKILIDEHTPPGLTKKEFEGLLNHAVGDKYSFLHINLRAPRETRYRKNLDTILQLS